MAAVIGVALGAKKMHTLTAIKKINNPGIKNSIYTVF